MIRIILPFHLRTLAQAASEVTLEVTDLKPGPITQRSVLDGSAQHGSRVSSASLIAGG